MSDLLTQLRNPASHHAKPDGGYKSTAELCLEAADEIEDLQGRNFVNRNAIKFMREKLDRYKAALEAIELYAENRIRFDHDSGEQEPLTEDDRFQGILEETAKALRPVKTP